eukprot:1393100-Alexandrium_andersonii.AAC.1
MDSKGPYPRFPARLPAPAASSGAIGIWRRTVNGKVQCLAVGQLRVQGHERPGGCELRVRPGQQNPVD